MTISDWIQLAIAIPTLCGFLWVVGSGVRRVIHALAAVLDQVQPNGGNTDKLGDRVVKLGKAVEASERKVVAIADAQENMSAHLANQDRQMNRLEAKMDQLICKNAPECPEAIRP